MALVPLAKVRIIGPKDLLDATLEELHRLEMVHLAPPASQSGPEAPSDGPEPIRERSEQSPRSDELRFLATELEALLDLTDVGSAAIDDRVDQVHGSADVAGIRAEIERISPRVEELNQRLERLEDERVILPRYIEPLTRLLPLVPELADLTEDELDRLRLDTVALVLNTDDESTVELLREELAEDLGARFELVSRRMDDGVVGCVLVFGHDDTATVHELLGKEHVRHVALPDEYERHSLSGTVAAMEQRLAAVPGEIAATRAQLQDVLRPHIDRWAQQLAGLRAEWEQRQAAALATETARTFVLACWVPRRNVEHLTRELADRLGSSVVVEDLRASPRDQSAPVLMRNARPVRPVEFLVKLFDLPRPGTIDPTGLMALFLPIIFGSMVADVVYGALLLPVGLFIKSRVKRPGPLRDLASVLVIGAVWSIIFGFVFGEALGDLGKNVLGFDWALWFYRPDGLVPLLVFALALGATHIVLGLVLGIWQGWRERHRGEVVERSGTLLALMGVFGLAGLAVGMLPAGAVTPIVAAIVVGLVLMMVSHGRMGLLMGPLELIGTLSNVLSYLRIAAVGLASAYLAIVANRFAELGPLWFGIIVAAFFHVLNLALAGFSPMIQAMRLHYVEFFSKFFSGGGRPFQAFGARATASRPPSDASRPPPPAERPRERAPAP